MARLPIQYLRALIWLYRNHDVCLSQFPRKVASESTLRYLDKKGYISIHPYDPNLTYTLPPDQRDQLWCFLTKKGERYYLAWRDRLVENVISYFAGLASGVLLSYITRLF